jgi:hypothetical protein
MVASVFRFGGCAMNVGYARCSWSVSRSACNTLVKAK